MGKCLSMPALISHEFTNFIIVSQLTDVIKEESFSCSEEEMIWLEIKLNIMNLADTTKTSLKSKTQNSYYDICQWMKENIYCTTGPVGSLKAFIEERQIYLHCKPSSC